MGTINYKTSDYITLALKPYDYEDFTNENGDVDYDLLSIYYEDDYNNIYGLLKEYDFYYFHVSIEYGYYEGFSLNIEFNYKIFIDSYKDKRLAIKEVTQIKKLLKNCAGLGLVKCSPGWCTSYNNYTGTLLAIEAAAQEMINDIKQTPTYLQYIRKEGI